MGSRTPARRASSIGPELSTQLWLSRDPAQPGICSLLPFLPLAWETCSWRCLDGLDVGSLVLGSDCDWVEKRGCCMWGICVLGRYQSCFNSPTSRSHRGVPLCPGE